MIRKKEQHTLATNLRRRGFTYEEISKVVGVSKSTVSNWFSGEKWSKQVCIDNTERAAQENSKRISLLNKARSNQYKKLYREAERSAVTEYKHYRNDPLFVAGLMLYVGEGDTVDTRLIRLANSKMHIHRIFFDFVEEYLGVERDSIKFWLLLYPDLNEDRCVREWSKVLQLNKSQFYKNQYIQGKSTKRTLQHGVGNTIIGSAVLKKKLMKWIELALQDL